MLKCYSSEDNNCTKECNSKIKTCPMATFLNGERKTKPNRRVMDKFITTYKPTTKKNKTQKTNSENTARSVKKSVVVPKKPLTLEQGVEVLMKIAYGDDYNK